MELQVTHTQLANSPHKLHAILFVSFSGLDENSLIFRDKIKFCGNL